QVTAERGEETLGCNGRPAPALALFDRAGPLPDDVAPVDDQLAPRERLVDGPVRVGDRERDRLLGDVPRIDGKSRPGGNRCDEQRADLRCGRGHGERAGAGGMRPIIRSGRAASTLDEGPTFAAGTRLRRTKVHSP